MATATIPKIDIPTCWGEMISKLVGMIQASDDGLDAHQWAHSQFDRIGEFLDSIPVDDRIGFPPLDEYLYMQVEILTAESSDESLPLQQEELLAAMD